MKNAKTYVAICGLIAAIGAVASFLVSSEATRDDIAAFHSLFAISIIVSVLHTGAALIFLQGLNNFKAQLKVAYGFICAGFIMLGLTFLQTPLLSLYDLWDSPYVEWGGVIMPFVLAALFSYLGARKFARLLAIKDIWSSFWCVTVLAAVVVLLVIFVPHPPSDQEESVLDASNAFSAVLTTYLAGATVVLWRISKKVSSLYRIAIKRLALVFLVASAAGLQLVVTGLLLPHEHWYQTYGVSVVPFIVSGALALAAAYSFNKLGQSETMALAPAASDQPVEQQQPASSIIDAVTNVALLASNPDAIDDIMDGLRLVTSKLEPSSALSPADQKALAEVYLQLENYLVAKEPLRKFTKDGLRNGLRSGFFRPDQNQDFWLALK